jgi:hypothetical protein
MKSGRMEYCKVERLEYRVFTFHFSIIPPFQYSNIPSALCSLCYLLFNNSPTLVPLHCTSGTPCAMSYLMTARILFSIWR